MLKCNGIWNIFSRVRTNTHLCMKEQLQLIIHLSRMTLEWNLVNKLNNWISKHPISSLLSSTVLHSNLSSFTHMRVCGRHLKKNQQQAKQFNSNKITWNLLKISFLFYILPHSLSFLSYKCFCKVHKKVIYHHTYVLYVHKA